MKLKLLPSLKEKKRYVVFEVISDKTISYSNAINAIIDNYKKYFGIFGMEKSNLAALEDWKNQRGIIKVNNKFTNDLKASLPLIKTIDNQNVIVRCIGVSGTLNKTRQKYFA